MKEFLALLRSFWGRRVNIKDHILWNMVLLYEILLVSRLGVQKGYRKVSQLEVDFLDGRDCSLNDYTKKNTMFFLKYGI